MTAELRVQMTRSVGHEKQALQVGESGNLWKLPVKENVELWTQSTHIERSVSEGILFHNLTEIAFLADKSEDRNPGLRVQDEVELD